MPDGAVDALDMGVLPGLVGLDGDAAFFVPDQHLAADLGCRGFWSSLAWPAPLDDPG